MQLREGQRRGDVEIRNYLRDQAGSRSLVFDLSIAHERFGSSSHVQQNGSTVDSVEIVIAEERYYYETTMRPGWSYR